MNERIGCVDTGRRLISECATWIKTPFFSEKENTVSAAEKKSALLAISNGANISPLGKAKYRVGRSVVHVRFCSQSKEAVDKFKFNINPNTLSADFELWVCGSASLYYLMPVSFLQGIYNDPSTYEDRHHPGIKVVSVDALSHTVTYASGGVNASLGKYLGAKI